MPNPHNLPLPKEFLDITEGVVRVDEKGLLYNLEYNANYYLLEPYLDMLVSAGCSTFVTPTLNDEKIMCRNYDFKHFRYNKPTTDDDMTGLMVVVHTKNPAAKYESVGVADAFWLDAAHGTYFEGTLDDGKTDISPLAFVPFICMDGMNEKGLALSIMHLPTENSFEELEYIEPDTLDEKAAMTAVIYSEPGKEPQKQDIKLKKDAIVINTADKRAWKVVKKSMQGEEDGKKGCYHTVLMRLMLDNCATVEEAIYLANTINIKSAMPGQDYHIMAADESGASAILEWTDKGLNVIRTNHGTNYYLSREDHFGYGHDRDEILKAAINYYSRGMSEDAAVHTLALTSQDCRIDSNVSYSQYSCIYNMTDKSLKVFIAMDFDMGYEYEF